VADHHHQYLLRINDFNSNTFELGQNYPNPFTTGTKLDFNSPTPDKVEFKVFDMTGKLVEFKTLDVEQGLNTIEFGDRLSSGVYFYNILVNDKVYTKRMVKS